MNKKVKNAELLAKSAEREGDQVKQSCETRVTNLESECSKLLEDKKELDHQNKLLINHAEKLSQQLVTEQTSHVTDDATSMVSSVISVGTESSQEQLWEMVRYVRTYVLT